MQLHTVTLHVQVIKLTIVGFSQTEGRGTNSSGSSSAGVNHVGWKATWIKGDLSTIL